MTSIGAGLLKKIRAGQPKNKKKHGRNHNNMKKRTFFVLMLAFPNEPKLDMRADHRPATGYSRDKLHNSPEMIKNDNRNKKEGIEKKKKKITRRFIWDVIGKGKWPVKDWNERAQDVQVQSSPWTEREAPPTVAKRQKLSLSLCLTMYI